MLQITQLMGLYNLVMEKRKRARGTSSSDLVFSAYVSQNPFVFAQVMDLHVAPGAVVADITHGKGIFWKQIPENKYKLNATDLKTGVDCRHLPYDDSSIDCVIFDPPYMGGLFSKKEEHLAGHTSHAAFREYYSQGIGQAGGGHGRQAHEAIVQLYFDGGREAYRVLKNYGKLIVKCQDEIKGTTQFLTHIQIINEYEKIGYYTKDLFVVVRTGKPSIPIMLKQHHARKNHSYFIVFVKKKPVNDSIIAV